MSPLILHRSMHICVFHSLYNLFQFIKNFIYLLNTYFFKLTVRVIHILCHFK